MMKKATSVFAILIMIAGLCVGCGKSQQPVPEAVKESTPNPSASETQAPQEAHGHSHEGHSH